jgi:hypothetical protein
MVEGDEQQRTEGNREEAGFSQTHGDLLKKGGSSLSRADAVSFAGVGYFVSPEP